MWRAVFVLTVLLLGLAPGAQAKVVIQPELSKYSSDVPEWVRPGNQGSPSAVPASAWGLFDRRSEFRPQAPTQPARQSVSRADSAHSYDALHYDLDLFLQHSEHYISGELSMTFVALEEDLSSLPIHLSHLTCNDVRQDGEVCSFSHVEDVIAVALHHTMAAGDTAVLLVDYAGTPWTENDLGMFISGGVAHTLSDPWGTRQWAPCFDEPFDKARWAVSVKVGEDYEVLSNGCLSSIEDHEDGYKTWHYAHSYPISSYLVSVCSANYTVVNQSWGELPVGWMVYPGHASAAETGFSRLGDMLSCYSSLYGEYPFERYYMAEAPVYSGWGGMEHQTCTTMGSNLVAGGLTYEAITTHELSHQWWGDALTPVDFRHVWLNEGWATYSEAIYFQYQADGDWSEFVDYLHEIHQTYLNWDSEYLPIYDPPLDDLFNVSQYEKAASVIHMLRYIMGEESFWQSVHDWYESYLYQTVDSEDYRAILESASGLDLEWFFDQWIYQGGYPRYHYGYQSFQDADSCTVAFSVTQSHQVQDEFHMPVPVRVTTSAGVFNYRMQIDESGGQGSLRLPGEFDSFEFNPDEWILCRQMEVVLPDQMALSLVSHSMNDDGGGDGDGHLVSGESAGLELVLVNEGGYGRNLQFALSSQDPRISIEGDYSDLAECFYGETFTLPEDEVTISASNVVEAGLAELLLEVTPEGGETLEVPFRILLGLPEILLVDDDPAQDYSSYYTPALDSLGAWHDRVTAAQLPAVDAERYRAALYYTGDSGNRIDMVELAELRRLHNAGVAICITGQDAVDDWPQDSLDVWFSTMIENADCGQVLVHGNAETFAPIDALLLGTLGAANQETPSAIVATWNLPLAYYQDGSVAAVCTHDGPGPGARVLFGFGLEGVSGMANTAPLERWLDYALSLLLDDWVDVDPPEGAVTQPQSLCLRAVPNPFNPVTQILFELQQAGDVRLSLYDLQGRRVREILRDMRPAGAHQVKLEARSLASGIYLLHLQTAERSQTERVLLLK